VINRSRVTCFAFPLLNWNDGILSVTMPGHHWHYHCWPSLSLLPLALQRAHFNLDLCMSYTASAVNEHATSANQGVAGRCSPCTAYWKYLLHMIMCCTAIAMLLTYCLRVLLCIKRAIPSAAPANSGRGDRLDLKGPY
jgi:hypothetical protein